MRAETLHPESEDTTMRESSSDPRVERTLDAIDRAFRAMVLEGGLESLTVKALCARARVNKNTFYRYYASIEDLTGEVMAGYSDGWRRRSSQLNRVVDVAASTRELFYFGAEQDDLYNAITCDPAWATVQRRLQRSASGEHEEAVPEGFAPAQWHMFYAMVSQAGLAMYRAWVADGKQVPIEQAAQASGRAVQAAANSFMSSMGISV